MYRLKDIGILKHGPAATKRRNITINLGDLKIIDVPSYLSETKVQNYVRNWIQGIVALELPTSLICNLRCKYCYIQDPRMKSIRVHSKDLLEVTKHFVLMFYEPGFDLKKKNEIYFSPWGAEPFCEIDNMKVVLEFLLNYNFDTVYFSTSTNGTIINEKAINFLKFCLEHERIDLKSLQISIDGPPALQNRQRNVSGSKKIDTFSLVVRFTNEIIKLEQLYKKRIHHFCSTVHLQSETFTSDWVDSFKFFTNPENSLFFTNICPSRISSNVFESITDLENFVEAQRLVSELILENIRNNIPTLDFYSSSLFTDVRCKSYNAFPYCSALNTQLGVDTDGNIYPCHGPITTPIHKPWLCIGNVFEKVISFQQLLNNLSFLYSPWTRSKCTNCDLTKAFGTVCWSCTPHNLDSTGTPYFDYILKCEAFKKSFRYWLISAVASIEFHDSQIRTIQDLCDKYNVNFKELYNLSMNKLKNTMLRNDKIHFDPDYNGMTSAAFRNISQCSWVRTKQIDLSDTWFKYLMEGLDD